MPGTHAKNTPATTMQGLTALPLEWLEFSQRAELVRPDGTDGHNGRGGLALRQGQPITWGVIHEGRVVPFKIITHPVHGTLGGRRVLVLLHGMGINATSFLGVAPYLLATHDLLVVDYSSFSAPERWPAGGVSLRLLAAGVWRIIERMGLPRVDLLGSSLGGGLALLMVLLTPPGRQIDRIGLLNPAIYPQRLPLLYRLARAPILGELLMSITPAERLIEGVASIGYSSPEQMPKPLRQSYLRTMRRRVSRHQLMDIMRYLPANGRDPGGIARHLGQITQPTLILWGTQEKLLPPDTGTRLKHDLPHARLAEFPHLAHLPHEEAPEEIGPILGEFFK